MNDSMNTLRQSTETQASTRPPAETPGPSGRARRRRWNKVMRWVRRIHLFSGLFMLPWVLLYGSTALLFNHPTYFPDRTIHVFGPAANTSEPFGDLPGAAAIAREVVSQLKQRGTAETDSPTYRFVHPELAEFTRSAFARVKGKNAQYTVILTDSQGSGFVSIKPIEKDDILPTIPDVQLALLKDLKQKLNSGLKRILDDMELDYEHASFRGLPPLRFHLEIDGQVHRVIFNPVRGKSTVLEPTSLRRFLLQLHLAHMYPGEFNTRWFWAVGVDCMFASMLFWGFSGLFMFWQIKSVRAWGVLVLVASAVIAGVLMVQMHNPLAG